MADADDVDISVDPVEEHKKRFEKFENLSPRVKIYWTLQYIIAALVLIIVAYFTDSLLADLFGLMPGEIFWFILGISIVLIVVYLIWTEIYYRSFVYYIGEDELEIKHGVIRINTMVVPYEKIQNINTKMSWIERLLGLSTVIIETAGGYEQPEIVLPGIRNPDEVVSRILERVKVIKEKLKEEENFLEKAKEVIDVLDERIKDMHERVSKLEETMSAFAKQLNDIKSTVPKNTSYKFNDLESKIDFLSSTLDEIKSDLKRLTTAERNIEHLKERLKSVEEDMDALSETIDSSKTKAFEKEAKKSQKSKDEKKKKQKKAKSKQLKTKHTKKKKSKK